MQSILGPLFSARRRIPVGYGRRARVEPRARGAGGAGGAHVAPAAREGARVREGARAPENFGDDDDAAPRRGAPGRRRGLRRPRRRRAARVRGAARRDVHAEERRGDAAPRVVRVPPGRGDGDFVGGGARGAGEGTGGPRTGESLDKNLHRASVLVCGWWRVFGERVPGTMRWRPIEDRSLHGRNGVRSTSAAPKISTSKTLFQSGAWRRSRCGPRSWRRASR